LAQHRVPGISNDQIKSLLRSNVTFRRPYQGEIPKAGLLQMFFEARRPLAVILTLLGIFGLTKLRNSPYVVPLSVLAAGLGLLSAYRSRVLPNMEAQIIEAINVQVDDRVSFDLNSTDLLSNSLKNFVREF
jgi:hypothetical protein